MMGELCLENDDDDAELIINTDVLYEVLRRVDGVTLAKAACAGSMFHSVSSNEQMWERVCNQLWPSTRDPEVKSIVSSLGGFRKFYGSCFPLVINKQPFIFDVSDTISKDAIGWFDDEEDMIEELYDTSLDDFLFIVDVVFRGKPVVSRVLHGIPGVAGNVHGWFSNCPFRIDLVSAHYEEEDEEEANEFEGEGGFLPGMVIIDDLPMVMSIDKERKDGRFWKALWDDINLSWIIVNKKTKQMANLASWRPLGGQRHWPTDKDFLVRFGSILPAHELLSPKVVQCSVVLKCRLLSNLETEEGRRTSSFMITELSMQLEDMAGMHLNGRHSMLVLKEVLSCQKSMNHPKVLKSYGQYIRAQSELKEKFRSDGHVDVVCIICGILSFVSLCYFIL
ncbi:hypothetical protein GOP47_0029632 [Adiantum capillus-veneris]|nr:hypothetical protein GOP47_0029632 [Adiantum capillus-veneris]